MKESAVVTLLRCVWDNCNNGGWLGLNQAMYSALLLAVKTGFKFERDDFVTISNEFSFGRWGGAGSGKNGFAEKFYTAACADKGQGNRSAAIAFERFKKRPPFTFSGQRLAEGSKLRWWGNIPPDLSRSELLELLRTRHEQGECRELEVSSFAEDGSYLNAVWFEKPYREREYGKGPDKRFRITREDLKRVEKALAPEKKTPENEEIGP